MEITLVLANVNPSCSKLNTSSKGSTITFPLLLLFITVGSQKPIYIVVSSPLDLYCLFLNAPHNPVGCFSTKCWLCEAAGALAVKGTSSSSYAASSGPSVKQWGGFCLQLSLSPLGRMLINPPPGAFKNKSPSHSKMKKNKCHCLCLWHGVCGHRLTSLSDKGCHPLPASHYSFCGLLRVTTCGAGGQASRAPRSTNIIEKNFFSERNAFIARLAVWDDSVVTGTIFSLKKTPRYTEENNSRTVLILTL